MKKITLLAVIATLSMPAMAQKFMTRTAKITFDATSQKSPEKIVAINNEVASILNADNGEFVFQCPIKSFKFEKALMQEHFNENYMQSDKYPKSDFKGKISGSSLDLKKDGTYNVQVSGTLSMHGVTKEVSVPGSVTVKGAEISAKAKFVVKLADYNIEIPALVGDKVGKESTINVEAILNKK
jgi:polyisoprenoid-binding protein YceI